MKENFMNAETKYWSFTWDTNVNQRKLPPDQKLINFLNAETTKATFQLEKGEVRQKEHFQGVFSLKGPRKSKTQTLNQFKVWFKNVSGLTLTPVHSREAVEAYVTKEKGRIRGPFHVGSEEKDDPTMANLPLREWQKKIFAILTGIYRVVLQDRKIILVTNPLGGAGKSMFTKWLRIGQKLLVSRKLPVSSVDRLTAATFATTQKEKVDLFTVDLPRTISKSLSLTDIFHTLEEIKNGYLVDTMYGKYNEGLFDPPLVVVFTNFKFEELQPFMSEDRWVVFKLGPNQELCENYYDVVLGNRVSTPVEDVDNLIQLKKKLL